MAEEKTTSSLEQEVARQIAEGMLPATVERRLLREGHPEAEVKRLVEAERQQIEDRRAKSQAQAMVNTVKGFGLMLVALGTFLPWSVVSQPDLGLGTGVGPNLRVRAHGQDALALDGDRLGTGQPLVHGDDVGVVEDQARRSGRPLLL